MARAEMASIQPFPSDWPEHGEFDGERVRLADVETTLKPADRQNVVVELADGRKFRPWRNVPITYYDDAGNVVGGA